VENRDFGRGADGPELRWDTTSGRKGWTLLCRLQSLDSTLPGSVIDGLGQRGAGGGAMRRGARDCRAEALGERGGLLTILRTQIELGEALRRGAALEAENRLLRAEGGLR